MPAVGHHLGPRPRSRACTRPDPPARPIKTVPPRWPRTAWQKFKRCSSKRRPPSRALILSARITYAEDGYSKISSPLQGPVLDVRVKLGQAVKAGDVLMVIDAADIAEAYAAYVEEISELGLAERNYELTKDLYDAQAMSLKDLEHAENDLNRERAEFKQAKGQLLSLRVPAAELEQTTGTTTDYLAIRTAKSLDGNSSRTQRDARTNRRACHGYSAVYRGQSRTAPSRRGRV